MSLGVCTAETRVHHRTPQRLFATAETKILSERVRVRNARIGEVRDAHPRRKKSNFELTARAHISDFGSKIAIDTPLQASLKSMSQ